MKIQRVRSRDIGRVLTLSILSLFVSSCALLGPRVAGPAQSLAGCYKLSIVDWRNDAGAPTALFPGARDKLDYLKLVLEPGRELGRWAVNENGSLLLTSGGVMEGWSMKAQRNSAGFTGAVSYFHDAAGTLHGHVTARRTDCATVKESTTVSITNWWE